jgi:hypothetical protein
MVGQNGKAGAGTGGPGWIRIEAGAGALPDCEAVSAAPFRATSTSVGCSRPLPLGVGPAGGAFTQALAPEAPALLFEDGGRPEGTDGLLLWRGAEPSLDVQGVPGPLRGGVEDPRDLPGLEFVRFSVLLLSDPLTGNIPRVEEVRLPYRMED